MRIGIIGAGAMGCAVGGHLAAAGEDVVLLEIDPPILEAIEDRGVIVERPDGPAIRESIPIVDAAGAGTVDPVDVAFVFTKSFDTARAIEDARPMLGADATVATVQNGLANYEVLLEAIGRDRVLGGYTHVGSNTIAPGHVEYMGEQPTVLGGPDRDRAEAVAATLEAAGLPTEPVADPLPHIWTKQLWNVARKPLSALTELRNGPQVEYPETRHVASRLIAEAVAVAEAQGVEILPEDPIDDFVNADPGDHYDKKSSILEDVEAGRRTEIDAIAGPIVRAADEHGIAVPYNRMALALTRGKERGYLDAALEAPDPAAFPVETASD